MKTRNGLFADVPENLWNDWHWQVANRAETVEDLKKYMSLTPEEEAGVAKTAGQAAHGHHPLLPVPDSSPDDPHDPVRQAWPSPRAEELQSGRLRACRTPCTRTTDSPAPGLTHRYPDRVPAADHRPVLHVLPPLHPPPLRRPERLPSLPVAQVDQCHRVRAAHTPQVRDVLLSGGDALLVSDERSGVHHLQALRAIPHVEIVRHRLPHPRRAAPAHHSRAVQHAEEVSPRVAEHPLQHPEGVTPEAAKACAMLADAGIPLGNQSVLLAGVNDCVHVMMELVHELVKMRVRPYYIYACDLSLGLSHFRTPVSKGIEIMEALRGHTSGYCVPTFVVDAPGGGGKTPVMPNYLISETPRKVILRNFEGVITSYTQPEHYVQNCHCDVCTGKKKVEKTGVAWVAEGTPQRYLEPTKLLRNERHVKK